MKVNIAILALSLDAKLAVAILDDLMLDAGGSLNISLAVIVFDVPHNLLAVLDARDRVARLVHEFRVAVVVVGHGHDAWVVRLVESRLGLLAPGLRRHIFAADCDADESRCCDGLLEEFLAWLHFQVFR